jgi:hypothetical protein
VEFSSSFVTLRFFRVIILKFACHAFVERSRFAVFGSAVFGFVILRITGSGAGMSPGRKASGSQAGLERFVAGLKGSRFALRVASAMMLTLAIPHRFSRMRATGFVDYQFRHRHSPF